MDTYSPTLKIPYTPSQNLRYELSRDKWSRKRFEALVSIHKELQTLIPEIPISFCMFGSLTKGKVLTAETAKYTDVDLSVHFDQEDLDRLTSIEDTQLAQKLGIEVLDGWSLSQYLKKTILQKIEEKNESLELGSTSKVKFDLFVHPINSRSIKQSVDWVKQAINPNNAELGLAFYFTVSIGNVVNKYRNKFLKELAESSDKLKANKTWNLIKRAVENVERNCEIPEKARKQFPQTLEEALKFYEVEMDAK